MLCFPLYSETARSSTAKYDGPGEKSLRSAISSQLPCQFSYSDNYLCDSDLDPLTLPEFMEESIAGFIKEEHNFVPGFNYFSRFQTDLLDVSVRIESIAWIFIDFW
ncbi:hypothetical protein QN277_020018 [Acacia crassicarpa]|uniref:Uncharacterized protein n=1 Tax=Acacia crassicarpa TaxID=499986 RepID=A0AAE1JN55_9FABA|nr:hypothetical protein QN277_020018 [Acacia crassicarpa]